MIELDSAGRSTGERNFVVRSPVGYLVVGTGDHTADAFNWLGGR